MSDHHHVDPPSAFVATWAERLARPSAPRRRALDVAMGRGRHAEVLARAGYHVFGVDWQLDAVREAVARAQASGLVVRGWVADLTRHALPEGRFELVVVTRYLQRDLFPAIRGAMVPGAVVLYETFTERQITLGWGPRSPEHLLKPSELRDVFVDFDVLFYEEVEAPEAVARLVARRRSAEKASEHARRASSQPAIVS
jgi:SAM-dependent methyltransferase